jgi:RHS repeat-associated protein
VRLKTRSDDAQDQRFEHDEAGRITATTITLKDDNARSVFTTTLHTKYDAQGQPIAKTLADGQALRIERDAATGVARQLTLQSARWARVHERLAHWLPATWAATARGWLPQDSVVRDIAFHPYNGITGLTHGNGLHTSKQFDIAGRLTALNAGTDRLSYGYGAGPRIRKLGDKTLEYTGFGQLKEQDTARVIKTATNAAAGMAKLEFDNLGRIVNDGVNRYTFTADGQVRSVSTQDNRPIATYRYNALRQRVGKTVEQRTTYFLWHDGKLVAEIEGSGEHAGQISAQYLYLADEGKAQPIAKLEAAHAAGNTTGRGRTLFIHANHRGEPMAMSNGQQRVVWRASSDAWGFIDAAQLREQQAELNIRLPGQYFDAESGLHDNWHRSYDPRPGSAAKGRYLSPDPAGYPDGPDAYAYVNGDPINKTDATGLYEEDVHYYMTYFLARVAGLAHETALTMAQATYYIDSNPFTRPLDPDNPVGSYLSDPAGAAARLGAYHFTQGGSDPARIERWYVPTAEERAAAIRAGYAPLPPYIREPDDVYAARRLQNPGNPQITRLRTAANTNLRTSANPSGSSPCMRVQLFGEFLHAFQDTFGHRDQNNAPINVNGGLGHLAYGHEPDRTYNDTTYITAFPSAIGDWSNREARTLQMERETFAQIQRNFGTTASDRNGMPVEFSDIQAALQRFNGTRENDGDGTGFDGKQRILNEELARLGFVVPVRDGLIPRFNPGEACRDRQRYLASIATSRQAAAQAGAPDPYPGVIARTPQTCPA